MVTSLLSRGLGASNRRCAAGHRDGRSRPHPDVSPAAQVAAALLREMYQASRRDSLHRRRVTFFQKSGWSSLLALKPTDPVDDRPRVVFSGRCIQDQDVGTMLRKDLDPVAVVASPPPNPIGVGVCTPPRQHTLDRQLLIDGDAHEQVNGGERG
jgi:hypothetical protein